MTRALLPWKPLSGPKLVLPCRARGLVRSHAEDLKSLGDEALRSASESLCEEIQGQRLAGKRLLRSDASLARAFSLIFEAIRRTTGKSYYDVQLEAGIALARGSIAEMQTGEGKTLTTALPAFVFALFGRGVHVATTNQYLAERDCEELRPALEMLGLSVCCRPSMIPMPRSMHTNATSHLERDTTLALISCATKSRFVVAAISRWA